MYVEAEQCVCRQTCTQVHVWNNHMLACCVVTPLQDLKERLNQMEADLAGERNTMALGYKVCI
jgi:hypothetical protein